MGGCEAGFVTQTESGEQCSSAADLLPRIGYGSERRRKNSAHRQRSHVDCVVCVTRRKSCYCETNYDQFGMLNEALK